MPESIHLRGQFAEQFKNRRLGDKVKFSVEGEVRDLGVSEPLMPNENGKPKRGKKEFHVEIYMTALNGKAPKSAKDMDEKEVEKEIGRVKGED